MTESPKYSPSWAPAHRGPRSPIRLEGELTEIRAGDLRFSLAEAGELFAAAGVDLPGPAVAALYERTEGWAAGLRLAALAAAGHPDPQRFAAEFSGTERTVAEYLLAGVLDRQPQETRRLLLRTSILEWVNGELADLLTGGSGGERVLQDLEAANAFVVPLDGARSSFRYHQLFAGLLRLELRRAAPGEVAGLHRAAAAWFAGHGYPAEAVRHAQATGDWELAVGLLAGHCPALYLDARQRADPAAVADDAQRLQAAAEAPELAQPRLAEDLRALALISLGEAEIWTNQVVKARGHLEQGVALARQVGRPFLEFAGLADLAITEIARPAAETGGIEVPLTRRAERARQAIELAERHGWTDEPAFGVACRALGATLAWQGRPEEAEPLVQHGERTATAEARPVSAVGVHYSRGLLELARRGDADALTAFEAAERLAQWLDANVTGHRARLLQVRAMQVSTLVRLGDTVRAEKILASLEEEEREGWDMRVATAALLLARDRPRDAAAVLAPVLDDSASPMWVEWLTQAFVLEAIARDALGEQDAADRALERALDLAEPNGAVLPFLLYPAPALLERHARHRTAHAALSAEILGLLAGNRSAPAPAGPRPAAEPLSNTELRVLRYLPTNLTSPEIARELSVSPNTVRTHVKNLYAKLGAHRRAEAVARARDLGLLAPSARGVSSSR